MRSHNCGRFHCSPEQRNRPVTAPQHPTPPGELDHGHEWARNRRQTTSAGKASPARPPTPPLRVGEPRKPTNLLRHQKNGGSRLSLPEASLLAGLIQAPSTYDPFRHPALARARQVEVLRSLVRNGFSSAAAARALDRPLRLRSGPTLPPVRGADLSSGPAFAWSGFALGAAVVLFGIVAVVATRLRRLSAVRGLLALRLLALIVAVVGAAAIVRSFRTA
jgi:hypothetical protein